MILSGAKIHSFLFLRFFCLRPSFFETNIVFLLPKYEKNYKIFCLYYIFYYLCAILYITFNLFIYYGIKRKSKRVHWQEHCTLA